MAVKRVPGSRIPAFQHELKKRIAAKQKAAKEKV